MASDLYAKRAGEGEAVILLHGLFGAGANLGSAGASPAGAVRGVQS